MIDKETATAVSVKNCTTEHSEWAYNNARAWVFDFAPDNGNTLRVLYPVVTFYFTYPEDATAFKLRFGL